MPPTPALFVVDKIIEQAARENIALSEVERKMLLFSESSHTLPDIAQVNEVFDRECDRAEYETKVVGLIRGINSSLRKNAEARRAWNEAIQHLRGEDYYFMVMLNEAGPDERPSGDLIRLFATAIAIVAGIVTIAFLFVR